MKLQLKKTILALALVGSAACLMAQDDGNNNNRRPHPQRDQEGPGRAGQRPPPPPPLISVLDANHDGVIDAAEIDNASAALRKLDKNGDGQLTQDEVRPPRPNFGKRQDGPRGPGNGQHPHAGPNGHPPIDDNQDGPAPQN